MRGHHEENKKTNGQITPVAGQRGGHEGAASAVVDGRARQGRGPEENKQGPFSRSKWAAAGDRGRTTKEGDEQERTGGRNATRGGGTKTKIAGRSSDGPDGNGKTTRRTSGHCGDARARGLTRNRAWNALGARANVRPLIFETSRARTARWRREAKLEAFPP